MACHRCDRFMMNGIIPIALIVFEYSIKQFQEQVGEQGFTRILAIWKTGKCTTIAQRYD